MRDEEFKDVREVEEDQLCKEQSQSMAVSSPTIFLFVSNPLKKNHCAHPAEVSVKNN